MYEINYISPQFVHGQYLDCYAYISIKDLRFASLECVLDPSIAMTIHTGRQQLV